MVKQNNPQIYVACLASYNNGILHGEWIDANQSAFAIQQDIDGILASSPAEGAEEWAIHDYQDFGDIKIGEHEDLNRISELAELIVKHGHIFSVAYDNFRDIEDARCAVEDKYYGCFRDVEEWAESFLEDTGYIEEIPDHLRNYFDYAAYARDAVLGGSIWTAEDSEGTHVFCNH